MELSYNEIMSIARRVERIKMNVESSTVEQLQQRSMAMGYFLFKLFEAMPTISKNSVVKMVGAKGIQGIKLGDKDTAKRENAKINYDIKKVFEHVTHIKPTELWT
jgi:hypothetical protein